MNWKNDAVDAMTFVVYVICGGTVIGVGIGLAARMFCWVSKGICI